MTLSQFDRKEMATVTATTRMVLDFLPQTDNVYMGTDIGCSADAWNQKPLSQPGLTPPPPLHTAQDYRMNGIKRINRVVSTLSLYAPIK